jgi:hypothetical protein
MRGGKSQLIPRNLSSAKAPNVQRLAPGAGLGERACPVDDVNRRDVCERVLAELAIKLDIEV